MSGISTTTPSILESLGLASTPEVQKNSKKELGQNDFLQLMIAQLKHQDPFKPMENGEFLSQLAQFSTVNGIQALQGSFGSLVSSLQSVHALQASSLVGRQVLVKGDTAVLPAGGRLTGMVDLPASSGAVNVGIFDSDGHKLREIRLGTQAAGKVSFEWNGTTDSGRAAAPGTYRVRAEALMDGQPTAVDTLVRANVESVSLGQAGQEMVLNLSGLGPVGFSQVTQVY